MTEKTVHVRFLLGPSGSGKSVSCLQEVRRELLRDRRGPPLLFLAPKQATYQIERQLLTDPELGGYTRLQILSFERLAQFVLDHFRSAPVDMISDEGRTMILRALLMSRREQLQSFRASSRLPGFAKQLNELLRELQQSRISSAQIAKAAAQPDVRPALRAKLHDLALITTAYQDWLRSQHLDDPNHLLDLAAEVLSQVPEDRSPSGGPLNAQPSSAQLELCLTERPKHRPARPPAVVPLGGVWMDGFAEMTAQEIELLAALAPLTEQMTLAFCLDEPLDHECHWLSTWSLVGQTVRRCVARFESEGITPVINWIPRRPEIGRFVNSPLLAHLEAHWTIPKPYPGPVGAASVEAETASGTSLELRLDDTSVRLVNCGDPECESRFAARQILKWVRNGGRFRGAAVIVRHLDLYADPVRRAFRHLEIPFFMDRREPVAHHPLAELTDYALRTVAFHWRSDDWFGALKTGLVPLDEADLDWMENEALAHGWEGDAWLRLIQPGEDPESAKRAEQLRQRLLPPFQRLAESLRSADAPTSAAAAQLARADLRPTGKQLAAALRRFWSDLKVEDRLEDWAEIQPSASDWQTPSVHRTVWDQMNGWLDNVELAFPDMAIAVRDWLPILESGLSGLTVGIIPPALDQVLVGAVDRSRNPDLQLVVVLGLNETIFPATPAPEVLLSERDRAFLEEQGISLAPSKHRRLGHERYLGYIACTRPSRHLVLTFSSFDSQRRELNPSPLVHHLEQLFPGLKVERWKEPTEWFRAEHLHDLRTSLFQTPCPIPRDWEAAWRNDGGPSAADWWAQSDSLRRLRIDTQHSQEWAARLHENPLRSSVTRLEQFAACPFKFFTSVGLRAEERLQFEADPRRLGDFQHQVLKQFHDDLKREGKRWHDLTPDDAGGRIRELAQQHAVHFNQGLLHATARDRFQSGQLALALERFIRVIVGWMPQYEFEPAAVELRFGPGGPLPAWTVSLPGDRQLSLVGMIDRVDLWVDPETGEGQAVVLDYKSSARKFDPCLWQHGIRVQLPIYLNVLRRLPEAAALLGVIRIVPAGLFYISLRALERRGESRRDAGAGSAADSESFRHFGRFNRDLIERLDTRPGVSKGDQFNYSLNKDGRISGRCKDPISGEELERMLDQTEERLRELGIRIFAGEANVDPYRRASETACQFCDFRSVCRIDPWTHNFRRIRLDELETA